MRKSTAGFIVVLILCFFCFSAGAQTFSYYYRPGDGSWQNITIVVPPGHDKAVRACYVTSNSKSVEFIKEIKDADNSEFAASVILIGSSPIRYVLAMPKTDVRYIVLSDEKQIFKAVFVLDSNIFNPPVKKSVQISSSSVNALIAAAFKALLF